MSRRRRGRGYAGILAAGLAALPIAASADDERLTDYMARPAAREATAQAVRRQMSQLPDLCQSMKLKPAQRFVEQPVQFGPDGSLTGGVVREVWMGEGCGRTTRLNIWTAANGSGSPRVFAALPGNSMAALQLQTDTQPIVSATATASGLLPKDCRAVQFVDTAFKGFEGEPIATVGGVSTRPWKEEWTVAGCGGLAAMTVHFVPDKTGTGMRVPSGEGRKIERPANR